ncbi:hypothetical protein CfE428DRAFT_4382 [Chthoniobacter flavus Ellin428]|uniref:Uncharacterized protein n=2 Tax=Chthoniobacter flavus TaxID=191863 RepID=B4D643_9BACT|nr:hypothetical protein CfE428DRAFT_4382 [Chthoniobacter flavus Ellin428]TCO81906.1 hypothetical protein EV701_1514 [Chthoniobacter flavus]
MQLEELLEFIQIYSRCEEALFTPAHLTAAFLLHEGTLDDEDFGVYTEGVVGATNAAYLDVKEDPDKLLDYSIYKTVLNLDSHPFASAPVAVGKRKFGAQWRDESKKERWKVLPTDYDRIELGGKKGVDIITPDLAKRLVPRLYEIYGSRCDW